jgi:hypothetical protein
MIGFVMGWAQVFNIQHYTDDQIVMAVALILAECIFELSIGAMIQKWG